MDKWLVLCLVLACVLLLFFATAFAGKDVLTFIENKPSPSDWVHDNQIQVTNNKIIINIPNAKLVSYSNTKSMDPTIDQGANGIEIQPSSTEQIHVGDIVAFKQGNEIISHRVVEIGNDEYGWFCKVKGDNSPLTDKIRFQDIVGIVVAIIY